MNRWLFFVDYVILFRIRFSYHFLRTFHSSIVGNLLLCLLNKSILSVWVSRLLRFSFWVFSFYKEVIFHHFLDFNSVLGSSVLAYISSLCIWLLDRFWWRFILNEHSKRLRTVSYTFWRIKTIRRFRNFRSHEFCVHWWALKILNIRRGLYLAFKVSVVWTVEHFLFSSWIYNYSRLSFLGLINVALFK